MAVFIAGLRVRFVRGRGPGAIALNPATEFPNENAGIPMLQQLTDLTLAELEDLVPVVDPVLVPVFGPLGLLRYPTKPESMAVHLPVSICTYLQGSPLMDYENIVRELLSSEVHQAYTTIKTEQQAEEKFGE